MEDAKTHRPLHLPLQEIASSTPSSLLHPSVPPCLFLSLFLFPPSPLPHSFTSFSISHLSPISLLFPLSVKFSLKCNIHTGHCACHKCPTYSIFTMSTHLKNQHPEKWNVLTAPFQTSYTHTHTHTHVWSPLPGKAIKLLFSTSPQTLTPTFDLAPVCRGPSLQFSSDAV